VLSVLGLIVLFAGGALVAITRSRAPTRLRR
jgi:hypothetical protein